MSTDKESELEEYSIRNQRDTIRYDRSLASPICSISSAERCYVACSNCSINTTCNFSCWAARAKISFRKQTVAHIIKLHFYLQKTYSLSSFISLLLGSHVRMYVIIVFFVPRTGFTATATAQYFGYLSKFHNA